MLEWTGERGLDILPYGLDLSKKLIELAKDRLPEYKENLYSGNAWHWDNPTRFDYVRTELVYVPQNLQRQYIERIIDVYVNKGGKLLVAEYRSSKDPIDKPWIDITLREWGFNISRQVSDFYDNKELTRVSVIKK